MTRVRPRLRLTAAPRPAPDDAGACVVPFQSLSELELRVVEEAIFVAWSRVPAAAARAALDLDTADEESITRLLRNELDALRRDDSEPVPGFSERSFQHVTESESAPDASGRTHTVATRYPDLVFRPSRTPKHVPLGRGVEYGLFVECKILDPRRRHHHIHPYCMDGILRFVSGEYAAAMPNAMMLAYVRHDWSVPSLLAPYLAATKNLQKYQVCTAPALRTRAGRQDIPVYASSHRRPHVLVWDRHAPGDIELLHLWLDCRPEGGRPVRLRPVQEVLPIPAP